ncbi:MAG: hypothetical protein ACRCYP_04310 [Alphaproteobacteria bacterium]
MNYILNDKEAQMMSISRVNPHILKKGKSKEVRVSVRFFVISLLISFGLGNAMMVAFQDSPKAIIEKFIKEDFIKMPNYHGFKPSHIVLRKGEEGLKIQGKDVLAFSISDLSSGKAVFLGKGAPSIGDFIFEKGNTWTIVKFGGRDGLSERIRFISEIKE